MGTVTSVSSRKELPCSDAAPGTAAIALYIEQALILIESWGDNGLVFVAAFAPFSEIGCPGLEIMERDVLGNLCIAQNPQGLKPVSYLCPETCACASVSEAVQSVNGMNCP